LGFGLFEAGPLTLFLTQAGVDREALETVKRAFRPRLEGLSTDELWLALLVLLCIVLLALILRAVFRPKRHSFAKSEIDQVEEPKLIRELIQKSVDLRSIYDIEVFDRAYREIYKGSVLGINRDGLIEVEVSNFTDPALDFRDKEVRVAFRMSRLGQEEYFQFDTVSKFIGLTEVGGRREKAVRLVLPRIMVRSQKRRFLRVQPRGKLAFKVDFLAGPASAAPLPAAAFRLLHQADISDISIGGLQAVVTCRGRELRVRPQQELYARFRLPTAGLDVADLPDFFLARAKVLEIHRKSRGRRIMSREADANMVGPHLIRVTFTARGRYNAEDKTISFRPTTPVIFDDLARWIHAYQRYVIQEEKDTKRKPLPAKNMYSREPLEVTPKYPPQNTNRGSD